MMNFICVIEFFSLYINESFSDIWLEIHNLDSDLLAISEGLMNWSEGAASELAAKLQFDGLYHMSI